MLYLKLYYVIQPYKEKKVMSLHLKTYPKISGFIFLNSSLISFIEIV